jgi:hypothetical protein
MPHPNIFKTSTCHTETKKTRKEERKGQIVWHVFMDGDGGTEIPTTGKKRDFFFFLTLFPPV